MMYFLSLDRSVKNKKTTKYRLKREFCSVIIYLQLTEGRSVMTDYTKNFSLNLRDLRIQKGLTQKEVADLLQYSEKTVSKWECGACIPDIDVLFKLANIFKVSIENLFADSKIYFLGIDGGGTKTALALADEDGNIIRTLKTEGCNPVDIGIDRVKVILKDAIYEICKDISLSSVYCFAGIAGGTSADMQPKIKEIFEEFGFKAFANDSDNKNIIESGLGDADGMTVIMGTGVCVFKQINKQHSRIAGWGYFIDNGGSGYNLGRDALNAYFTAYDKTGEDTLITEEIDKIYPGGPQKLIGYIYNGGKKVVASFAPAVFSALEKGDRVAERILKQNTDEVVKFIETAAKDFGDGKIPVVLAGGITSQKCVVDNIKNSLTNAHRYDIKALDKEPVYGAVNLAFKLKKEEKDDE